MCKHVRGFLAAFLILLKSFHHVSKVHSAEDDMGANVDLSYATKSVTLSTSRPNARDGHRYLFPALVFCNGSSYVSRAAAPEGTGGDEVL